MSFQNSCNILNLKETVFCLLPINTIFASYKHTMKFSYRKSLKVEVHLVKGAETFTHFLTNENVCVIREIKG